VSDGKERVHFAGTIPSGSAKTWELLPIHKVNPTIKNKEKRESLRKLSLFFIFLFCS
jgi:hypothetical protein